MVSHRLIQAQPKKGRHKMKTHTADDLRAAVLRNRPEGRHMPIDLLEMERQLDQIFANAEAENKIDRELSALADK